MPLFMEHRWSAPAAAAARSEILTWDGRLDNRGDLRAALGIGSVDDETLLAAAYDRWGLETFARLVGDWSVAVRDPIRRAIVFASDFMGTRPLYYRVEASGVRWATRLAPLTHDAGLSDLDEQYVGAFLVFGGSPTRTPWRHVRVVGAGHAVCVTADRTTVVRHWAAPTGTTVRFHDERRYEEGLRSLFSEAVAVRLQDEPAAMAELSGGLDSSAVVCMADRLIRLEAVAARRLMTVSYVHAESTDTPFIGAVEDACGLDATRISTDDAPLMSAADVGEAMPEGWVPLYRAVASVGRRVGTTTLLSGLNGDLLMGNWHDDSLQVAGRIARGQLRAAMREALGWSKVTGRPLVRIMARALAAALPAPLAPAAAFATEGVPEPDHVDVSLNSRFSARTGVLDSSLHFSSEWRHAPPERRNHFRAFTLFRELRVVQRREVAPHLNYTHPYAHRPLVEFLMSVPADVLCRPGEPRRLMRRALGALLPPAIRRRRSKSLFGAPWVHALRPVARSLLKTRDWRVVDYGWVDRDSLTGRLHRLVHGLECHEAQLRNILLLECWLRNRETARSREAMRCTA